MLNYLKISFILIFSMSNRCCIIVLSFMLVFIFFDVPSFTFCIPSFILFFILIYIFVVVFDRSWHFRMYLALTHITGFFKNDSFNIFFIQKPCFDLKFKIFEPSTSPWRRYRCLTLIIFFKLETLEPNPKFTKLI